MIIWAGGCSETVQLDSAPDRQGQCPGGSFEGRRDADLVSAGLPRAIMPSAHLNLDAELEATLTPRQRELIGKGRSAAGSRRHESGRALSQLGRSGRSVDEAHSERISGSRADILQMTKSVDTVLNPFPPAPKAPRQDSGLPLGEAETTVYRDDRLGFAPRSQRNKLEEILGGYQANQAALEELQRDLQSKRNMHPEQARDGGGGEAGSAVHMSRHKIAERQMHGLDEVSRAKVRKILLLDPETRSEEQVKELIEWTLEIDLFYGLTMHQRTQLCKSTLEAVAYKEGDVLLRMGDASSSVHVLFEGNCAIYLDRSNNKANESSGITSARDNKAEGMQRQLQMQQALRQREREKEERELGFSKIVEEKAKARKLKGARKKIASLNARPMAGGQVAPITRRRNAIGGDSALPPVQVCFAPGDDFGSARAFHNIDSTAVQAEGFRFVSHTVQATADVLSVVVSQLPMLQMISTVYKQNIDDKIAFMKTLVGYKGSSEGSLVAMARLMKRRWIPEGKIVVKEGDEPENVHFCVDGQLKVVKRLGTRREKVVNVLGCGSSFGDWGVVNDMPRAASMVTVTNSQLLAIVSS